MTQLLFVTDEQLLKKVVKEAIQESNDTKGKTEPTAETEFTERLDRKQAAQFIGVSYQCMYNYTKSGFIPVHGKGKKRFYLKAELIEAMKNNK